MEDIEKELHPKKDVLQKDEHGVITSVIVDEELDGYECSFDYDTIEIRTDGMTHITLSTRILYNLLDLIEKADKMME